MPVITFNTVLGALTDDQKSELSIALTNTVGEVLGEKIKPNTWIIINEAPEGNFHIGGHLLTAETIKKAMN